MQAASRRDILAGLGLIAIAGGLVGLYRLRRALAATPPLDAATFCRLDAAPARHTALLIDRTDAFTPEQTAELRRLFQQLRNSVAVGERLSVFLIGADAPAIAQPVLSRCNPGDPSSVNEWFANRRRVQARWQEVFGNPLDALFADLRHATETAHSPIIETMRAVLVRDDFAPPVPRRLIVFSDMLQNMPTMTQYGRRPDPDRLAAQLRAADALPALDGVAVEIAYLNNHRDARFQDPGHLAWWRRFLADAGAASVRVITP